MNSIIDIDRVIEELTAETGLDDFGDPTYRDGLDVLVAASTDEARLSDVGHVVAADITSMLKTRLLVEQWWSDHPELDEERIEAPIFIVGLSLCTTARRPSRHPRPGRRRWEASSPVPPPRRSTYASDARFEAAKLTSSGFSTSCTAIGADAPRPAGPAGRVPRPDGAALRGAQPPVDVPDPHVRGACR